jgi:hypothetical protein
MRRTGGEEAGDWTLIAGAGENEGAGGGERAGGRDALGGAAVAPKT